MKDYLIKISTLFKVGLTIAVTVTIYNAGAMHERESRKAYWRNIGEAQAIDSQRKWMSHMNDSIFKLVADRAIETINTF